MKDPAFLFYTNDFISGTQFLSNEELGIYIRLLCAQHQHGRLSEKQFNFICHIDSHMIKDKFKIDSDGKYYNERLEIESEKRKRFSESRRNNRNKLNNDSLHIYFIKNPQTGLIKIGSSVDVERRLIELKRQYNSELEVLFISEKYPQSKEKELHDIFKSKNHINEWFKLSNSDLEDIKTNYLKVHIGNHMNHHMENENEIENIDTDLNKKESGFNFKNSLLDLGIDKSIVDTFLDIRKKKKAVNSELAFNKIKTEISKSGLTANEAIKIACENSWKGFDASWVNKPDTQKEIPQQTNKAYSNRV
jgi:hypothetical protein